MAKFVIIFVLSIATPAAVWSQEIPELPWELPRQESVRWLNPAIACRIELVMNLDGSEQAANAYWSMSKSLQTPLEKQIMARVEYDIGAWWQSSANHTKQGLKEVVAKSISVLPKSIKCRIRVTTILMIPSPTDVEDATCQVQPTGCTILIENMFLKV